jgi:hypothetical protein
MSTVEPRSRGGRRAQTGAGADRLDKTELLQALAAFQRGDFSARLPSDLTGLDGKIADTFNEVIEINARVEPDRMLSVLRAWLRC